MRLSKVTTHHKVTAHPCGSIWNCHTYFFAPEEFQHGGMFRGLLLAGFM